ncbi:HTH-type transcriptional regulator YofA [compost metagenome]
MTGPVHHPLIEQHEVIQEELVLVSKSDQFSLDEITQKPMLLYNKGCGYRQKLESWMKDEGIIPKRIMEFGTFDMILAGVEAGIGLTILPKTSVAHHSSLSSVYCHQVPTLYRKITTVFIHRKDIFVTSTIQAFIDMIKHREEKM